MLLRQACRHLVVSIPRPSRSLDSRLSLSGDPLIALFPLNEAVFLLRNKVNCKQSPLRNARRSISRLKVSHPPSTPVLFISDVSAPPLPREDVTSFSPPIIFLPRFQPQPISLQLLARFRSLRQCQNVFTTRDEPRKVVRSDK